MIARRTGALLGLVLLLGLSGCASGNYAAPNGEVKYTHVSMTEGFDETSLQQYVGMVDNIFVGTVTEVSDNQVTEDDAFSTYKIHVEQNLKGALVSDIEVRKFGGYLQDGTLLLMASDNIQDTGIPAEGEQYVFMTYSQRDGALHLAEFFGNVPFTGAAQLDEYRSYIATQPDFERERYESDFEA